MEDWISPILILREHNNWLLQWNANYANYALCIYKCGILPQCGVIFLKILLKRENHFFWLLECSATAGQDRTFKIPALSFPSNVLHTEKTRIENGFERIRINGDPLLLRNSWSDREAHLWHGTSLNQIENRLEGIAIEHYTYYIYFWKAANV